MKRILLAGGLLLGLALLGTPAHAQTGTARGKVLSAEGQPIAEAKVELEYLGGLTRKFETKTNKKGEFTQVGMPPGPYKITASKEGFQGSFTEVRINLGDPTEVPEFKLRTMAAAQKAAGGGVQDEIKAIFKKGLDLLQASKLDEAEAAFKELLAKEPGIPEAHQNLGFIYAQRKDFPAAEAEYQKALELRPGSADIMSGLARVYQDAGQPDKAFELMAKAAGDNPQDAKTQFNLGIFYLNSGKSEEAIAAFKKAEAADPSLADAQYHLGTLMVGQNKIPEAIAYLEKYLAMNPSNKQNVATAQGLLAALKPKK
jgi:tetratricopeptide (TPR) repeat protein